MGRKVPLYVGPELVGRRLLADLGARTGGFWSKLSWDPRFEREERLLDTTFQAEDSVQRPCEPVATAYADWVRILKVSRRKPSRPSNKLEVCVPAPLPFKVAGLVST
jgi:hypothetical protein